MLQLKTAEMKIYLDCLVAAVISSKPLFVSQFEGRCSHMFKIISDTYEVTYFILAIFGM